MTTTEHGGQRAFGRYLFAFARGLAPSALAGVPALGDAAVEVVELGELQAVVCDVALAEFGEEALPRHLEDLGWLEVVARTHHEVVARATDEATVAPARLVTICSDDDSVRARIENQHDALVEALDRIDGRVEFGVKAFGRPESSPQSSTAVEARDTGQEPVSGAAYLRRKKELAERRRDAGARASELVEEVHGALSDASVAVRRLPAQDPRLTGRSEPMLHNGAYLVERDEGGRFTDLVRSLGAGRSETLVLEVQGPWPPYSFATLEG